MTLRRERIRGLRELALRVRQVWLVPVFRALEADAEQWVVEPDAKADVREHCALRSRLDTGVRRFARRLDPEEAEEVCRVVRPQGEYADADHGGDRHHRECATPR